jgi:hypothetical protein
MPTFHDRLQVLLGRAIARVLFVCTAYMAAIRSGPARKSAFWKRMRELGQN